MLLYKKLLLMTFGTTVVLAWKEGNRLQQMYSATPLVTLFVPKDGTSK